MGKVEEVSKQIIRRLLQDFQARELGAEDLENGYVGVDIKELRQKCFEQDNTSTTVDFDLALKALEKNALVETGPMEAYKNSPGSSVIFVGLYSKREFVFLTAKGYKAAR